jgi:hypothetical protein
VGTWSDVRTMKRTIQSRAEEFRAHAAECRALARRIRDRELKRLSHELARQWLELAERAERQCRRSTFDACM